MSARKTLAGGAASGTRITSSEGGADGPGGTDAGMSLPGLIELVEQALDLADTMGLTFVGLDLCSAREKLKDAKALEGPPELPDTGN